MYTQTKLVYDAVNCLPAFPAPLSQRTHHFRVLAALCHAHPGDSLRRVEGNV